MDPAMVMRPKQSISLLLEQLATLKNPKLMITLDDDEKRDDCNPSLSLLTTKMSTAAQNNRGCATCESLRRMLYLRDKTIMKLAEDRDAVKIKLTKAMNMNIELSRQLMKLQHSAGAQLVPPPKPLNRESHPSQNDEIRHELVELRKKCRELEDIETHLRQYLSALKTVFADLAQIYDKADEGEIEDVESIAINDEIGPIDNKEEIAIKVNDNNTTEAEARDTTTATNLSTFDIWYNS